MQTDPVCGMQIDERESDEHSEFEGRTYYFCSSACRQKFEENPGRYADHS